MVFISLKNPIRRLWDFPLVNIRVGRLKPGFNRPVQNLLGGQNWIKLDETS